MPRDKEMTHIHVLGSFCSIHFKVALFALIYSCILVYANIVLKLHHKQKETSVSGNCITYTAQNSIFR